MLRREKYYIGIESVSLKNPGDLTFDIESQPIRPADVFKPCAARRHLTYTQKLLDGRHAHYITDNGIQPALPVVGLPPASLLLLLLILLILLILISVALPRTPPGDDDAGLPRTRPLHEPITCFWTYPASIVKFHRSDLNDTDHRHVPSVCLVHLLPPSIAVCGAIRATALAIHPYICDDDDHDGRIMAPTSQAPVPRTPGVISATPTPSTSQDGGADGYFGPMTRSATRKKMASPPPIDEEQKQNGSLNAELDFDRARTRSRSPILEARRRTLSGLMSAKADASSPSNAAALKRKKTSDIAASLTSPDPTTSAAASNGHLSPASAGFSWRALSRSPSPLGLIPIHRHWRSLIHRHEIPRKVLHVSIGFVAVYMYASGVRTGTIAPYLVGALVPIFTVDCLRHRFRGLNGVYIRVCGALMRESEVDGWNGVIWYLLGAWIAVSAFPKDVAVLAVILLSWCDTAASTFGRLYGRYTPRIRRGKSLAGTAAAFVIGVSSAAFFWGWLAPAVAPLIDDPAPFMFTGRLSLPVVVRKSLGWGLERGNVTGPLALCVVSLWTGFAGAASEVIDLFGWDDNLTIPVLSGLGVWVFLKIFG